jgi:hypothetical protein
VRGRRGVGGAPVRLPEGRRRLHREARERGGHALEILGETATAVRQERIDQGVIDYYYTTTIAASWRPDDDDPYWDAVEPVVITVESVEYAISNPSVDRYEVISIKADQPIFSAAR